MLKSFSITQKQEDNIQSMQPRCESTCNYLHPVDVKASEACAEACAEKNRDIYRMANASNYASVIALGILIVAIWFGLTHTN